MRLAKWGKKEILLGALAFLAALAAIGVAMGLTGWGWLGWLAWIPAVLFAWELWFFRDPRRAPPFGPNLILAPADGTVTHLDVVRDEAVPGGEAIRYSMFLSVFNVHLNRAPLAGTVEAVAHRPGRFLDARLADSSEANERNDLVLATGDPRCPRVVVRQIAGKIARRIVCDARAGDALERGAVYGMIKFGSRTTLLFPPGARIAWKVGVGDKVKAGETVVGVLEEERA